MMTEYAAFQGPRFVLDRGDAGFPDALRNVPDPPDRLYVVGNPDALQEGLAIVGARKATPYGISCAKRFSGLAADAGIAIISGGARGCDAAAHEACIERGGVTVVFLGGGCDEPYPAANKGLFQRVVDSGGALVSENDWHMPPLKYMFRARNRLIAGLAKATLIVEAGLPSGTFSTADEALAANREVLAVPGAITSKHSQGANQLIYQGATPIVDDGTFHDQMFAIFGSMTSMQSACRDGEESSSRRTGLDEMLMDALEAQQLSVDEMAKLAEERLGSKQDPKRLMVWIAEAQKSGRIAKFPSGRYGAVVRHS